ncbi:ABC transporter permease [Niabella sp. W65]|nr:ABC transporter permease [Niabella sp. W65]MCH7367413.1 ABC transporter permease [Niabella sp. W65]
MNSELFILASIFLAVFMSILIPNALKATQVLMVIASPAFIMSGFTWPAIAMPSFINAFTSIVPLTPYLNVLKISLVEQGGGSLTMPFAIHLLVLIVIFFMLSWLLLILKKKKIAVQQVPELVAD